MTTVINSDTEHLLLPQEQWSTNFRTALRDPRNIALFVAAGLLTGTAAVALPFSVLLGPIFLLLPLHWALVGFLVRIYLKMQRENKIAAIMKHMPGRFTKNQLEEIADRDADELNRLFKLASDEFFRRYIEEQRDHKKAQQLILELHERISHMRQRIQELEQDTSRNAQMIRQLRSEIIAYEEILSSWKTKAA